MANEKSKIKLEEILKAKDLKSVLEGVSFEDGLKLLEELVAKVESGSLPLETAVGSYECGVVVVEKLRALLSQAEQKLKSFEIKKPK